MRRTSSGRLEYWDLERHRYPHFKHIAVLVAEDITNRFHNVISLFSGSVPIIAVQVAAFDLGDGDHTVTFTPVLNAAAAAVPDDDDDDETAPTTRSDWAESSSPEMMVMLDRLVGMLRDIDPAIAPKYNSGYIGLATDGRATNFVVFRPLQQSLVVEIKIPHADITDQEIAAAGLDQMPYHESYGQYRIRLVDGSLDYPAVVPLLADLFRGARDEYRERWPSKFPGRPHDDGADDAGADPEGG